MRALRPRARVSYCETEEPDLDQYVFCEKCGDYVYEYCSIHGPLLVIPDDKVPAKHNFPPCVPRAALTIPHVFLHLNYSSIPGAGVGVFTTLTLPKGVRFGPYRGVKTTEPTSDYSWQIYGPGRKPVHVVDASDGARSNWMRFVNCSRSWREQNLLAYQYQGELYYRTIKIIPRHTELLVFYGTEFANKLNIDLAKYNAPKCYAQKYGAPAPKKSNTKIQDITKPDTKSTSLAKKITTNIEEEKKSPHKRQVDGPKQNKGAPVTKKSNSKVQDRIEPDTNSTSQAKKVTTNIEEEKKTPHKWQIEELQQENGVPETKKTNSKIQDITEPDTKSTQAKKITTNIEVEKKLPHKRQIDELQQENGSPSPKKSNTKTQDRAEFDTLNNSHSQKTKVTNNVQEEKNTPKRQKEGVRKVNKSSLAVHKCDTCNYETVRPSNLKRHLLKHSGEKPYSCNVCSYKCKEAGKLKIHVRTHTGEKPYSCNVCSYKCTKTDHLKRHVRTHTGEKPYSCNVCSYKCKEAGNLKIHLRTHTGEKPYSCNVCSYKCTTTGHLIYHIRTHTGEKPYSCNVCSYKCTTTHVLKRHFRTHTGEKPHSCNVCSYKCKEAGNLKKHLRTHTGEKPYSCNVCSYKCKEAGSLKIHVRTHTDEKPYSCNVCSYKCTTVGALKRHGRTHTGEKPYSCNVCSYKCKQASDLKTHVRTHTGEKPYSCDICAYRCTTSNVLKKHLENKHLR